MNNTFASEAVLILAGGASQRSGTLKGLRNFFDKYWLEHQIEYFTNLNFRFIFVGLGHNYQEYFKEIPILEKANTNDFNLSDKTILSVSVNNNPENGMFSTLQNSLINSINKEWSNLFLLHIDMALPQPKTLENIYQQKNKKVVRPVCINSNKSGHPILLSKDFCSYISKVSLDSEDSRLDYQIKKLNPEDVSSIIIDDPSININMNTHDDWHNYLSNILTRK